MIVHILSDSFRHALMITSFVMVVMLIIEYLNVQTRGTWSEGIQSSRWMQIVVAAFLGIIPGCLGTFTVVSLYSHRIMNFASLVTVMIASSGDEAFLMLAMIPDTFLWLTLIIFIIAILTGLILSMFPKISNYQPFSIDHSFHLHQHDQKVSCFVKDEIIPQLKNISFTRALFIIGITILLFFIGIGEIGPEEWNWVRTILFSGSLITLFIVITVPEHFLEEHVWEHIIKKHFLKIFLWSFGAILVIHLLEDHFEVQNWIQNNIYLVLIVAVLVGLIPESGPHMVFISLFMAGTIPLSILLVNSIVQDGHGSLPLLAESKRSFLYMKFINMAIGLIVGLSGIYFGW